MGLNQGKRRASWSSIMLHSVDGSWAHPAQPDLPGQQPSTLKRHRFLSSGSWEHLWSPTGSLSAVPTKKGFRQGPNHCFGSCTVLSPNTGMHFPSHFSLLPLWLLYSLGKLMAASPSHLWLLCHQEAGHRDALARQDCQLGNPCRRSRQAGSCSLCWTTWLGSSLTLIVPWLSLQSSAEDLFSPTPKCIYCLGKLYVATKLCCRLFK